MPGKSNPATTAAACSMRPDPSAFENCRPTRRSCLLFLVAALVLRMAPLPHHFATPLLGAAWHAAPASSSVSARAVSATSASFVPLVGRDGRRCIGCPDGNLPHAQTCMACTRLCHGELNRCSGPCLLVPLVAVPWWRGSDRQLWVLARWAGAGHIDLQ